jgi:hypothetical protein
MADAVGNLLEGVMTWWVKTPSVDLSSLPLRQLQDRTVPLIVLLATCAMIWAGTKTCLSRRGDPLVPAGRGLLNVVLATGLGITLSTQALRLGDALSRWLLDAGAQGQAAHRMGTLVDLASLASGSPVLVIVLGVIVFLVTLAQWLLLLLRQAGIVFLAPLLPLAAATSMTSSSSPALRRVLMWELSLLAYKPMVAFVYLVGFQVLGQASGVQGVLIGTVILVLAVIAMPALLRFFSWAVDPSATGLHDGGRILAGAAVALSVTQTAAMFGAFMARSGPGSVAAGGGAGSPGPTGADPAVAAPLPALPPGRRSAQRALPAGPSSTPTVESA